MSSTLFPTRSMGRLLTQPINLLTHFITMRESIRKRRCKAAIDLYEQLLLIAPNSVQAPTNLGVAFAHEGRYSAAIEEYREALKQDPQSATIRLDLALAWYKQADFAKAAVELELLRKRHPENKQALYLLADCYLRLGKYRADSANS